MQSCLMKYLILVGLSLSHECTIADVLTANTQPISPIIQLSPDERIKSDPLVQKGPFLEYEITCIDETKATYTYADWKFFTDIHDINNPDPKVLRKRLGVPFCTSPKNLYLRYFEKSENIENDDSGNPKKYSVTCLDNSSSVFTPLTSSAGFWSNGKQQYNTTDNNPKANYSMSMLSEFIGHYGFMALRNEKLRSYVGERYCGHLSKPVVITANLVSFSTGQLSQINREYNTYMVTCAGGNTSTFTYDFNQGAFSNGIQTYKMEAERRYDKGWLNQSIGEQYCMLSPKLPANSAVKEIIAANVIDQFGAAVAYKVVCNAAPSHPAPLFKRQNQGYTMWTNYVGNNYTFPSSDAAHFSNKIVPGNKRMEVFMKNIAVPYCTQ